MATTVTDDFVIGDAHEAETNMVEVTTAALSSIATDTIAAEGTNSVSYRVGGAALDGSSVNLGSGTNVRDAHIFQWVFTMQTFSNISAGGVRMRISSATDSNTNYGEWVVGGQDTSIGNNKNFQRWCVDTGQPYSATNGTVPATSSITAAALLFNFTSFNGRISVFFDQIAWGNGITLTAGTAAIPGNSDDVAADDLTNGRGCFQDVGGVFYILGGVTIGDVGATDSHFTDTNKVWNFEDQNVSATFHRLAFVGGTGTNKATFGVLAGSGVAEEGSGGNTFNAAGIRPFRVKAEDERIGVGLYGCTLTNPTGLRSDAPRAVLVEDNSGSSFADDTYDAIDAGANDVFAFATATPNTNDSLNIGHNDTFSQISVNVGTAGVGAYTTTWEYMVDDTPTWAGLSGVIDDTASFQTAGTNTVSWTNPYDWGSGALGGRGSHYWIRARKDAGSETTRANISQITADMGGSIVWAHTGAKMIRCTLSNMDTITVRSGAFIKKCTITDSVATSGNGALDLGTGNPATNSVRDLTIQNCNKGILLKGTSTGSTSYDFQNIQFANNTNDVRVDFPAAGTVVINVLEGGSTPTVDNVNGSTVTINNSVTLTVTVKDAAGAAIENAQTAIYLDSDSSELLNADTNASGVASVSFAYTTDVAVTVRVRKSSTGATKYFSVASPQTIGSDGLNVTITLLEDIIVT